MHDYENKNMGFHLFLQKYLEDFSKYEDTTVK